jgi:uncharacterized membrane protein
MSSSALRKTMIVLAAIGLGVAGYLTYIHYAGIVPLCGKGGGSCEKVQTSVYAEILGIPVPLLGLIGYILILVSLLIPQSETTRLATVILTGGGFAFSAYLTYREVFTLKMICEWCVSSAVIMTILMCLSVWRFLRGSPAPPAPAGVGPAAETDAESDQLPAFSA